MGQAFSAGLRDSYSMAHLLLFSAEDHLRTILAIRDAGPLPQFALYTLLRAASEAAVRSRYLLDASITETQRLARALNERLDNVIEQRRVDPDAMQTKFDEADPASPCLRGSPPFIIHELGGPDHIEPEGRPSDEQSYPLISGRPGFPAHFPPSFRQFGLATGWQMWRQRDSITRPPRDA